MNRNFFIFLVGFGVTLIQTIARGESDSDRLADQYSTADDYINHLRQVVKDYEACKDTAKKSVGYYSALYEIDGTVDVVEALDSAGSDNRSRVKVLAPLLRSSNEQTRAKAYRLMGLLKSDQPLGVLLDGLLNDSANRITAAKALAKHDEQGVKALISALKNKNLEVIKAAATGLGSISTNSSRQNQIIVPALAEALYCKDNETCDLLMEALGNYPTVESVSVIVKSFKDSDIQSSQIASAMAAIKIGELCVLPLISLAGESKSKKEADTTTRWVAAALGDLGDPRAVDVLQKVAEAKWALPEDQNNQHPEPPVRLDYNKKNEDLPFWSWNKNLSSSILWQAAHEEFPKYDGSLSEDACAQACYALARLGDIGVDRLSLITANTNIWVRAKAIEGLMLANSKELIKSPETILALARRFNDDDPYVNRIAHSAAAQVTQCTTLNGLYAQVVFRATDQGKMETAKLAAKEYEEYFSKQILQSFDTESEDQRLLHMESFQGLVHPFSVFECIPEPRPLANAILKYKGLVMDSIANSAIADYLTNSPAHTPIQKPSEVDLESVQKWLGSDTALLEFVRYYHHTEKGGVSYYGVMVIGSPATEFRGKVAGQPFWITLGPTRQIDAIIKEYESTMRGNLGSEAVLNKLWQQLLKPVCDEMPQAVRKIIISPDGDLSFVNLAALVDDQKAFVAQKYSVSYVSSGRDLLRDKPKKSNNKLCIFANPDFNKKPITASENLPSLPIGKSNMRDYNGLALPALPGTQAEMQFLKENSISWSTEAQTFEGLAASEIAIKQIKAPRVLHIATHGFFLSDKLPSAEAVNQGGVTFYNPMQRSGLAFAGAGVTLEAWKNGETPPTANDGILTAEEVSTMDLQGTWLVTLSACDTGIGEAAAGEGVMGLRRGFVKAGAQNLLMALWPVSDKRTVEFMEAFYKNVMTTGNAPEALADVQRDMLVKIRSEKGVLAAARYAGPFILTFQGRP